MPDVKPLKPSILLQLDTDPHPSVFDAAVAVDSGVDHLFRHGNVRPEAVRDLVHGLLFTRGANDLRRSAVFVGGSDVAAGEAVLRAVRDTCFGPFQVSVLHDSKGANTTAAAAVLAVERSLGGSEGWNQAQVLVLGAGPVGRRVGRLTASLGSGVAIGTPDPAQAAEGVELFLMEPDWPDRFPRTTAIVAAGPAGVEILPALDRQVFPDLRVAVDLNAVPPHGLGGTKPTDNDTDRQGVRVWGALGVGAWKMKIHKAVVRALFEGEPTVFDLDEVCAIGRRVLAPSP